MFTSKELLAKSMTMSPADFLDLYGGIAQKMKIERDALAADFEIMKSKPQAGKEDDVLPAIAPDSCASCGSPAASCEHHSS